MRPSSAVHRLHHSEHDRGERPRLVHPSIHPLIDRVLVGAEIDRGHVVAVGLWFSVGSLVVMVAWVLLGPAAAASALGVVVAAPIVVLVRRLGRRDRRLVEGLPDMVDMIARSLRSGLSLSHALVETAVAAPPPAGEELSRVVNDVRSGHSLTAAIFSWVERSGSFEVRAVGAAIAVAASNETGATRALDGVSQSLRDRQALDAEIRALTSQSSASTRALVGLPAAFLAFDALAGRHALRYLFGQPFGRLCFAVAVCLEALGWWWMRSIVKGCTP